MRKNLDLLAEDNYIILQGINIFDRIENIPVHV